MGSLSQGYGDGGEHGILCSGQGPGCPELEPSIFPLGCIIPSQSNTASYHPSIWNPVFLIWRKQVVFPNPRVLTESLLVILLLEVQGLEGFNRETWKVGDEQYCLGSSSL